MPKDPSTRQSRAKKPNKPTPRAKAPSKTVPNVQSADTTEDIPPIPSKFEPALLGLSKAMRNKITKRLRLNPDPRTIGDVLSGLGFRKQVSGYCWVRNFIAYPITPSDIAATFLYLFEGVSDQTGSEFFMRQSHKPTTSNLMYIRDIDPKVDGKPFMHNAFEMLFPFQNGILRLRMNKPPLLVPYAEMGMLVPVEMVLPRPLIFNDSTLSRQYWTKCDFYRFTRNVCTDRPTGAFDSDLHQGLMNGLAKCCHKFHNVNDPCAVVISEQIDDTQQNAGGTGKGLLVDAIEQMVGKAALIDGKSFDPSYPHCWQNVDPNTRLVCFDETKSMKTVMDIFYSIITMGWTVNKKNKQSFTIPKELIPSVVILTNNARQATDESDLRRRFDVPITRYYNYTHQPIDDFKHLFFSREWDAEEWNKLYITMAMFCQQYLDKGYGRAKMPRCAKALDLLKKAAVAEIDCETAEFFETIYLPEMDKRKEFRVFPKLDCEQFKNQYPGSRVNTTNAYNIHLGKWLATMHWELQDDGTRLTRAGNLQRTKLAVPLSLSCNSIVNKPSDSAIDQLVPQTLEPLSPQSGSTQDMTNDKQSAFR